ncbi:hypothetical protein BC830DRAFT_1109784 [Chytriomyces sp. MP71]|nr:hypothetical protein BC830DRAFT_1109784 [Chytriomyces sp. MP71]
MNTAIAKRALSSSKGQHFTPLYLQPKPPPYCHTCGRVINSKGGAAATQNPRSMCSNSCRSRKPGTFDRGIEAEFVRQLREKRMVVCSAVEQVVFRTSSEGSILNPDSEDKVSANQGKDSKEIQERGMKFAQDRERVKCAARRLVVHGFRQDDATMYGELRYCEAITNGRVVEPSFAKGDWGVRWRE